VVSPFALKMPAREAQKKISLLQWPPAARPLIGSESGGD
jgi:hypothetical protein